MTSCRPSLPTIVTSYRRTFNEDLASKRETAGTVLPCNLYQLQHRRYLISPICRKAYFSHCSIITTERGPDVVYILSNCVTVRRSVYCVCLGSMIDHLRAKSCQNHQTSVQSIKLILSNCYCYFRPLRAICRRHRGFTSFV